MLQRKIVVALFVCCVGFLAPAANAQGLTWANTGTDPFTETNWRNAGGTAPPAGTIDPNTPVNLALLIPTTTTAATSPLTNQILSLGTGSLTILSGDSEFLAGIIGDGTSIVRIDGQASLTVLFAEDVVMTLANTSQVIFTGAGPNGGVDGSTTINLAAVGVALAFTNVTADQFRTNIIGSVTVGVNPAVEGSNIRVTEFNGLTLVQVIDRTVVDPGIVVDDNTTGGDSGTVIPVPIGTGFGTNDAFFRGFNTIGGVQIDTDGVLSNVALGEADRMNRIRRLAMDVVPADLEKFTPMRFVSLNRLAKHVAECRESGQMLPDDIRYLAGLQRIEYVVALPETNDIVLGGPAEGWKIDPLGNVVGATTGRAVMLLDDLIVAFKTYSQPGATATCSIDPTPEGLERLQSVASQMRTIGNPKTTSKRIEEALGPQVITLQGIDPSSHFARVMIAADYRMKRIGMKLDPAPIAGLPSYLDMIPAGRRGMSMTPPRWWLAPKFDTLHTDEEKLVWRLRGMGVECMAEEDVIAADGQRAQTRKASGPAQRWADKMTEKYEELADHDSTFGQLRNLMDLAVAAAIIGHQQLEQRVGTDLVELASLELIDQFAAPKQVASHASVVKKGRNWVISASGGVEVSPWQALQKAEASDDVAAIRAEVKSDSDQWWWQ